MTYRREPEQTRRRVLNAAIRELREHGAPRLTLESVARAAEVSKGGLLHHFPNKDALTEALLREVFASFAERVAALAAADPEPHGRWLRAYVRATYDEDAPPLEVGALLLSAMIERPELLALVRADAQHWHNRLRDDGIDPVRATIVRQAADAYWTERLIGVSDAVERDVLRDTLLALIAEAAI